MVDIQLIKECEAKAQAWLDSPYYDAETKAEIKAMLENEDKTALIDAFYQNLEFGTGGLRGIMGAGTNRMNKYIVGMATQGFANYILKAFPGQQGLSVVVGHGHAQVFLAGVHFLDVVGETLGGHRHGVDVHAVGAGTHDAAQAASAELEVAVEALGEFVRVLVEHVLHALSRFFIVLLCEPRFCSFDDFRIHIVDIMLMFVLS